MWAAPCGCETGFFVLIDRQICAELPEMTFQPDAKLLRDMPVEQPGEPPAGNGNGDNYPGQGPRTNRRGSASTGPEHQDAHRPDTSGGSRDQRMVSIDPVAASCGRRAAKTSDGARNRGRTLRIDVIDQDHRAKLASPL